MDGNPYARILQAVRNESVSNETALVGFGTAPARIRFGTVTRREPLEVSVAGIILPTQSLRINEQLTKGHVEKIKVTSQDSSYAGLNGELTGPVSCAGGCGSPKLSTVTGGEINSTDTQIREAESEKLEISLQVGDTVLLLTEDDQVFFVACRVVNAV